MSKTLEEKRRYDALARQKRVAKQRGLIITKLGGKCENCGNTDKRVLNIDHKFGGGTKERNTIGGGYYSFVLKKLENNCDEYQLLCCNCNQIKKIINNEERYTKHKDIAVQRNGNSSGS